MANELTTPNEDALANLTGGGELPLAAQMAGAEVDQQIVTARRFPRSPSRVQQTILSLATLDRETSEECVYALPRGGKPIRGPSVRFAEIVASSFGNCSVASRVVAVDRFDKVVIAQGVFWDLETGLRRTAEIRRRITDKNGRLFNDDMIVVTGNAAASIAMREAVLKGVPKALWRKAYEACDAVLAGDVKTLVQRRGEAIAAFATYGVTPAMIFEKMEIGGEAEIDLDEIASLRAIFKEIKDGHSTVEAHFPPATSAPAKGEQPKGLAGKMERVAAGKAESVDQETGEVTRPVADEAAAVSERDKGAGETAVEAPPAADTEAPSSSGPDAAPDDAALDAAYERGEAAQRNGQPSRTAPADLHPDLKDAWLAGWHEAKAKAAEDDNA